MINSGYRHVITCALFRKEVTVFRDSLSFYFLPQMVLFQSVDLSAQTVPNRAADHFATAFTSPAVTPPRPNLDQRARRLEPNTWRDFVRK